LRRDRQTVLWVLLAVYRPGAPRLPFRPSVGANDPIRRLERIGTDDPVVDLEFRIPDQYLDLLIGGLGRRLPGFGLMSVAAAQVVDFESLQQSTK
jgi:hypothetical protein